MPTAGPTLRIERLRAHVTATALCAEMGISRATLYTLERAAAVKSERTIAYREAIKTLRTDKEDAA